MEWRLLAVPGVLWSFCSIAVLPGVPASFHTSGQQGSPLPNTVASSDEGLHIEQRGSTALATPPQCTLSRRRSARAIRSEPLKISGKKSECTCDVTVASEPMEIFKTTQQENVLYFKPGAEFRGITLELEITHGKTILEISKNDLCVRDDSVWHNMSFRAYENFEGVDKWAMEATVKTCTKNKKSAYLHSFNWFNHLRVRANGSSCWRYSLGPECSSDDQDYEDESHQTIDPESHSADEDSTDASRHMNDLQRYILMVILPMTIIATIIIVVGVTLLKRKNVASQSRHLAGSCDAAGQQNDAIYESLGPEEVQEWQGQRVDRENSLYATWTSDTGGENATDIVSVQTGPFSSACHTAGHHNDPIYENLGPEEVQEWQGQRVDRENSLYATWTSDTGGENATDIVSVQTGSQPVGETYLCEDRARGLTPRTYLEHV